MKLSVALAAVYTAAAAAATPDGVIYTFSKSTQSPPKSIPTVSLPHAALFLAQRLGLDEHFSLVDARTDEDALMLLNSVSETQKTLFAPQGDGKQRKSFFIVEGLSPEQIFRDSSNSFTKVAQLSGNPTFKANRRLVDELISMTEDGTGQSKDCRLGDYGAGSSDVVFGATYGPEGYGSCKTKPNGGKVDTERTLISEDAKWLNTGEWTKGDIVDVFHLTRPKSMSKGNFEDAVANFLQSSMQESSHHATVVVIPSVSTDTSHDQAWEMSTLKKRALGEEVISGASPSGSHGPATLKKPDMLGAGSLVLAANKSVVNTTMGRCASTKDECEARTNSCSGHGSCKSTDKENPCFSCVCTSTKESHGTTYWGGPACQKRDISVQFWLFSGFGIAATALVAWGIGLLYGMGEADLPSVLSAGVAPTTHK